VWDAAPLETELLVQADKLVGGSDAVMVIDDTAVPKKGKHSVGVAWQYASALGKNAGASSSRALRRFAERHARHLAGRAQTLQDARKPMHTDPSTI
jgi:SRSO17 transposase